MGKRNYKIGKPIAFLKASLGMTLSEVLVVVAILAVLMLMAILSLNPVLQMEKTRDSRRKGDLKKIATALEDYAGDHPCYPDEIYSGDEDRCEPTADFGHYLKPIACDPLTHSHYLYSKLNECNQFVIYATLEQKKAAGGQTYAVASPNVKIIPTPVPTTEPPSGEPPPINTPVPTATTVPTAAPPGESGLWGCKSGVCVPILPGECPNINYAAESYCSRGQCLNPLNECH